MGHTGPFLQRIIFSGKITVSLLLPAFVHMYFCNSFSLHVIAKYNHNCKASCPGNTNEIYTECSNIKWVQLTQKRQTMKIYVTILNFKTSSRLCTNPSDIYCLGRV